MSNVNLMEVGKSLKISMTLTSSIEYNTWLEMMSDNLSCLGLGPAMTEPKAATLAPERLMVINAIMKNMAPEHVWIISPYSKPTDPDPKGALQALQNEFAARKGLDTATLLMAITKQRLAPNASFTETENYFKRHEDNMAKFRLLGQDIPVYLQAMFLLFGLPQQGFEEVWNELLSDDGATPELVRSKRRHPKSKPRLIN